LPSLAVQLSASTGPAPDLVLFDFSQNGNGLGNYELLARIVHFFLPRTQLAVLWTGGQAVFQGTTRVEKKQVQFAEYRNYPVAVLEQYRVPYLNFYASEDAFVRGGGAYVNIWDEGTHPSWRTHSYVADLLSRWCNVVLDKLEACDIDAAVPDGPALRHPEDFRPDEIWMSGFQKKGEKKPRKVKPLNMSNVCLRPFTKHSAYEPSPTSPRSGGGWRLYEDRPEKPGWIASSPSDWLWFPVQLGPARGLIVQYLRSYENLGDAEVLIRGPQPERVRNLTLLPGLWERATSETETEFWFPCDLYDARCGNTAKSRFHRLRGLKPGNYTVGFRLANGTGNKFKLITLLTC